MHPYGSLCVLIVSYEILCVPMDSNLSLWVLTGLYAFLCILLGTFLGYFYKDQ